MNRFAFSARVRPAPQPNVLQRAAMDTTPVTDVPPVVHDVLATPGRPLDAGVRAAVEPRLGHDFSRVRVHTGLQAAESARAVSARAYTVGRHVVFGAGQYVPGTAAGRQLIAHELAHTLQQAGAPEPRIGTLSIGAPGSAWEREAEHAARPGPAAPARLSPALAQVQRQPEMDDPLHTPLIEDWRREHGLPPGGVDESGNPVGPSDAEIKYSSRFQPPLCLAVGTSNTATDRARAGCTSSVARSGPADCTFRPEQRAMLEAAQAEALGRVRRALSRVRAGREGRAFAAELATRLFGFDPPPVDRIVQVLEGVLRLLAGGPVAFGGRSCADSECHSGATVAYVTAAGTLPIYICPLAFRQPDALHRTVLHEALHWAGIDADPATPEGYCEAYDCFTPCLSADDADAWAHYVACLGQPLSLRQDFRQKILESVEELP